MPVLHAAEAREEEGATVSPVPIYADGMVLFACMVAGVVVCEALIVVCGRPWASKGRARR